MGSSWKVKQNVVCNGLVFQKQAFLIVKDPFWAGTADQTALLHILFGHSKVRDSQSPGSLGGLPASNLTGWALPPGSRCSHSSVPLVTAVRFSPVTSLKVLSLGFNCMYPTCCLSAPCISTGHSGELSPPWGFEVSILYLPQLLPHWWLLVSLLCSFLPFFASVFFTVLTLLLVRPIISLSLTITYLQLILMHAPLPGTLSF